MFSSEGQAWNPKTGTTRRFASEADIDAVLQGFDGNHRAAMAALLHDLAALDAEYSLSISRGYVQRGTSAFIDIAVRRRRG